MAVNPLPRAGCHSAAVSQPSPAVAVPQHSPILTEHIHPCSQLQVCEGPRPPPGQHSRGAAGPPWGTQKRLNETSDTGLEGYSQRFQSILLHGHHRRAGRSQAQLQGKVGIPKGSTLTEVFPSQWIRKKVLDCENIFLSHHQS